MLMVAVMAAIRDQLGVDLPVAALFRNPTVGQLAALVDRQSSEGDSPLIPIKPDGDKPPLFLVHALGGHVLAYAPLAQALPEDQPLYAFESKAHRTRIPPERIQEMAAEYLAVLKGFRPQGPYHIGGWSMGGLVAFEMAIRLREDDQDVQLVLLDSYPIQGSDPDRPIPAKAFALAVASEIEDRFKAQLNLQEDGLSEEDPIQQVIAAAQSKGLLTSDYEQELVRGVARVCAANLKAMARYQPGRLKGGLTFIRAINNPMPAPDEDPGYGWTALCDNVTVVEVPGNHDSFLQPPNTAALVKYLVKFLGEPA